jgi:hypothetical protein
MQGIFFGARCFLGALTVLLLWPGSAAQAEHGQDDPGGPGTTCAQVLDGKPGWELKQETDPPAGGHVHHGDVVEVTMTWDHTDFADQPLYNVLDCVTVGGVLNPDLSLDEADAPNDGEFIHQFIVPEDLAVGIEICSRGAVGGDGNGYFERNPSNDACFHLAEAHTPDECMPPAGEAPPGDCATPPVVCAPSDTPGTPPDDCATPPVVCAPSDTPGTPPDDCATPPHECVPPAGEAPPADCATPPVVCAPSDTPGTPPAGCTPPPPAETPPTPPVAEPPPSPTVAAPPAPEPPPVVAGETEERPTAAPPAPAVQGVDLPTTGRSERTPVVSAGLLLALGGAAIIGAVKRR